MPTIHDKIEEVLAAAVHDELSDEERHALHIHLVECADCRQLHKEDQLMNKAMEEVFAGEKPDFGFEKRLLYSFRERVRQRPDFSAFFANLLRSRAVQLTAVTAVLLTLVQMGRLLTGEKRRPSLARNDRAAFSLPSDPITEKKVEKDQPMAPAAPEERAELKTDNVAVSGTMAAASDRDSVQEKQARSLAASGVAASVQPETPVIPIPDTPARANRKLIRNAQLELEVQSFEDAVQKITALAEENRGYLATTHSQKQENGKLRGDLVVKVLPENLDRFLQRLHGLGELKNQTLGTEDVSKQYYDTDARLKNAKAMEERLLEILKKKSDDINDLLAVEKELGRVRERIEQLQGELKVMDAQVQLATVTITLSEMEMDTPAAFLLKERAQLTLFAADVEKAFNEIKALASASVQITNANLDRTNSGGRITARINLLLAPDGSDSVLAKVKALGRVENYQVQSERISRGGSEGLSPEAKTERDLVVLTVTIMREEDEAPVQETTLQIRATDVNESARQLRGQIELLAGRVRASSFSRDPNGREYVDLTLRVPMRNYQALMQKLGALGKLENVTVHREEHGGAPVDQANAPADISLQIYNTGNIVNEETGLAATFRRTLAQGAAALMWSVQMIGVALAFFVPWILPLAGAIWVGRRIARARAARRDARL